MFGCSDGWFGRRFSHALTSYLNSRRRRTRLDATGTLEPSAIALRDEQWRHQRERDIAAGRSPYVPRPLERSLWGETSDESGDVLWSTMPLVPLGREWRIRSTPETVDLGLFDPGRAPIVTIASGDVVVYERTWTHFLNRLQPGVTVEELGELRKAGRGRGVHSIVGPVAVEGAQPGDLLEIRFITLRTIDFGANFHNPAELGTGALPSDFERGHIHYFDLHGDEGFVVFDDKIRLELRPFQGTFGVADPSGRAVSSVAPGQHAGNIDVKELTVGSTLFVPVWQPGALVFTGDSHALQGDGEVNITALETAMEEVRVQIILHKCTEYRWPMIETATHWLMLGMHESLDEAARIALRNALDFLEEQARLSREDAYGLASLAVDFRISQMVDVNSGVHAMIPKRIFAPDVRTTMRVAKP